MRMIRKVRNENYHYRRRKKRWSFKHLIISLLFVGGLGFVWLNQELRNLGGISFTNHAVTESFSNEANQVLAKATGQDKLPLILQKDPRWRDLSYGLEEQGNTLAKNGCAISSLAMVVSYYQGRLVEPTEILNWCGNQYYVVGQGTSWQFFADGAAHYGLSIQNLGASLPAAHAALAAGQPLIVSVKAGTFTTTGHIMVLTQDKNGALRVYDPNDDTQKRHYQQTFTDELFLHEAVNYWAFS